jgi:tRNA 2-thiouridine synthesizing protein A
MTLTLEQLEDLKIAEVVDARGTSCPGPILAAKKAIGRVPADGIMQVLATDSGTLKDLPAWCKKMGHEYLGSLEESGYLSLLLKKIG